MEKRRCQAYLRTHLRGDQRCPQGLLGERHQRCRHLHRARQKKDRHRHGRRLCLEETGKNLVRFRRLSSLLAIALLLDHNKKKKKKKKKKTPFSTKKKKKKKKKS